MDPRDDGWTEFAELWDRFLGSANDPTTVTVVEGERDRRSLRRLGVSGEVLLFHSGRGLSRLTRTLAAGGRRVIVLTDWDREGGHLAHRLTDLLSAEGVRFDVDYRRRLSRAVRGEVAHVEGLATWVFRAAERAGVSFETTHRGPGSD